MIAVVGMTIRTKGTDTEGISLIRVANGNALIVTNMLENPNSVQRIVGRK